MPTVPPLNLQGSQQMPTSQQAPEETVGSAAETAATEADEQKRIMLEKIEARNAKKRSKEVQQNAAEQEAPQSAAPADNTASPTVNAQMEEPSTSDGSTQPRVVSVVVGPIVVRDLSKAEELLAALRAVRDGALSEGRVSEYDVYVTNTDGEVCNDRSPSVSKPAGPYYLREIYPSKAAQDAHGKESEALKAFRTAKGVLADFKDPDRAVDIPRAAVTEGEVISEEAFLADANKPAAANQPKVDSAALATEPHSVIVKPTSPPPSDNLKSPQNAKLKSKPAAAASSADALDQSSSDIGLKSASSSQLLQTEAKEQQQNAASRTQLASPTESEPVCSSSCPFSFTLGGLKNQACANSTYMQTQMRVNGSPAFKAKANDSRVCCRAKDGRWYVQRNTNRGSATGVVHVGVGQLPWDSKVLRTGKALLD